MELQLIEKLTKDFADSRAKLAGLVTELELRLDAIKRAALPAIRRAVADTAAKHNCVRSAVEDYPKLFTKPRTQIFHGIRVGYRKGTGAVTWDDDDRVVALIEKHFPRPQADLLLKTTKRPIAKALADLDVKDLKAIGCTVESTDDQVLIKPVDTAVDKLVNALLKDATAEATQEAA